MQQFVWEHDPTVEIVNAWRIIVGLLSESFDFSKEVNNGRFAGMLRGRLIGYIGGWGGIVSPKCWHMGTNTSHFGLFS